MVTAILAKLIEPNKFILVLEAIVGISLSLPVRIQPPVIFVAIVGCTPSPNSITSSFGRLLVSSRYFLINSSCYTMHALSGVPLGFL